MLRSQAKAIFADIQHGGGEGFTHGITEVVKKRTKVCTIA